MNRLRGKCAIITGAAWGVGKAIAARMAEEGAGVGLIDLNDRDGRPFTSSLRRRGLNAHYAHCDVAKECDVACVFPGMVTELGGLDILVNTAGVRGSSKPSDEITEAERDFVLSVNAKGVLLCTKHAIPYMKRVGGGSITNLSSICGLVGAPASSPDLASKTVVRLMTKTDALRYATDGIRVNSIYPGFMSYLEGAGDDQEGRQTTDDAHPLGHLGEPDDIAWGAVYLASDDAKFVTGSELVIDGGYTVRRDLAPMDQSRSLASAVPS
jgi:NAD(P)-dependent dehydrogenase (short-subunit alcohol dehydrogenase family)